ncbi:MAG TPA: lytic transglycosylase domain-containing protein [Anaerolineae bacterium]|nr:lytic transglycosylase domain-containing protein [Anaerolineae bacterium]
MRNFLSTQNVEEQAFLKESSPWGCLSSFTILPISITLIGIVLLFFVSQVAWASYDPNISNTISSKAVLPQDENNNKVVSSAPLSSVFTEEVLFWRGQIIDWSERWNTDPNLIATIMQIESCGNPQAESPAGAIGLFQVMPYHFTENEDPYKPRVNARRGIGYLNQALESSGGDIRLGFAGYNGGINGAKRPKSQWSDETTRFVYWGLGIYEDASSQMEHSDRLDEWLAHGGSSLCKQAASVLKTRP